MSSKTGQFLAYLTSTAIASGTPFVLSIVLARWLPVEDAGAIAIYTTSFALAGILVGLGAYASVQARWFIDPGRFSSYLSASVAFHAITAVVLSAGVVVFRDHAAASLPIPTWALIVAVLAGLLQSVINIHLLLAQAKGWATRYLAVQLAQSLLVAVLAPVLAVGLRLGWKGFVLAHAFQGVALMPANLRCLRRSFGLTLRFDPHDLWRNLRYGVGLLPHSLAGFVIVGYDRLYVAAHAGVAATGIYSVMLQIGMLLSMAMTAANKVYTPWLYARLDDERQWPRIGRITRTGALLIVVACCALIPVVDWLIEPVLGAKYTPGQPLAVWVVMAGGVNGVYLLVTNMIFYRERVTLLSVATVSGALAKWFALPPLFALYGPVGAAMSNVVGLLVATGLTLVFVGTLYDRRVLVGWAPRLVRAPAASAIAGQEPGSGA